MLLAHAPLTASWYGTTDDHCDPFKHTHTASGEKFNENKLTCAMRNHDFGKKFKITNLKNGKSVTVVHNDFGPSKKLVSKGRAVDLSRAAFMKIADLKEGVIPIQVEAV